jgi:ketosteroid isomerase-like protein
MKKTILATIALLLIAALSSFASPEADSELRAQLRAYREALVKKDIATLEQIWSDDYTFVNAHGELHTKADRLADLKSGHTSLESIKHEEEPTVRIHGNTAIIGSRVTITGKYSGHEVSGEFRSTHIWIKDGTRWRLVMNQLTAIAK